MLAGLTEKGALDATFGSGGFVALDIEPSCGFGPCHTVTPMQKPAWVVRRLTPAGAVDTRASAS